MRPASSVPGMALIPRVDFAYLAALLGIRPWHPADADDLAVLRDLLARRGERAAGPPDAPPRVPLID